MAPTLSFWTSCPLIWFTLILVLPASGNRVVISQQDEDAIRSLATEFNKEAWSIIQPTSSRWPTDKLCNTRSYKALSKYGEKVVPYLARQEQLLQEAGWIVGAACATRPIRNLEDLRTYQEERCARIIEGVSPWFHGFPFSVFPISTGVVDANALTANFSLARWWEENRERFQFTTRTPLDIDPRQRENMCPHISTEMIDGLLTIEASGATYQQIIERAAAEMGIPIFIGEQRYMDVLTSVRMRGVTFEEFAYLIGYQVYTCGFTYRKAEGVYHFGGNAQAKPRRILNGWGIAMDRTVFVQGQCIPIIVVTRGTEPMVDPRDPAFRGHGSFRLTDNNGQIIKDYLPQTKPAATLSLLQRSKDGMEICLVLDGGEILQPGEYNATFKYAKNETPSIAFEVYPSRRQMDKPMPLEGIQQ